MEGDAMARDAVANMVNRLEERGFDPRRVGHDSWESRCPAHRSADHALSITRNEHNHVELKCRSTENCQHFRIIGALGFTNDHVYEETPDSLISRLSRVPIQPASFASPDAKGNNAAGTSVGAGANGSTGPRRAASEARKARMQSPRRTPRIALLSGKTRSLHLAPAGRGRPQAG